MIGVRSGIDEYGQPAEEILSGYVGEFKYFGFESVPPHCLACDGSEVSRETYSELFAVFGETFGAGDGVTTFNLPDFRGAFLRCIGGNAAELGVVQGDAIRNIKSTSTVSHAIMCVTDVQNQASELAPFRTDATYGYGYMSTGDANTWTHGLYFDASMLGIPTANENRPMNYAVNVCVVYE